MAENRYQGKLIRTLEEEFPHGIILKNDSGYKQGIPDLVIFVGSRYAILEVKDHASAPYRPNQEYYLERFASMSYAATIYPENEESIIDDLIDFFDD